MAYMMGHSTTQHDGCMYGTKPAIHRDGAREQTEADAPHIHRSDRDTEKSSITQALALCRAWAQPHVITESGNRTHSRAHMKNIKNGGRAVP